MSKPFGEPAKRSAFKRQHGRCAFCGWHLNELIENTEMNSMQFHHVMPDWAGGENDADNCVVLCSYTHSKSKDGCHHHIHHEGRFKGAVAGPDDFEYSHGHELAKHGEWVLIWNSKYRPVGGS